jgi:hypothetical protein
MLGPASTPEEASIKVREPEQVILLAGPEEPAVEEPPAAVPVAEPPSLPAAGSRWADFFDVCPAIAKPTARIFRAAATAASAERSKFGFGNTGKGSAPGIARLMLPAIPVPMAGFRLENLRGCSATDTWRTAPAGFTGATASALTLPVWRPAAMRKDQPLGEFVEPSSCPVLAPRIQTQSEPFCFTIPSVRFRRIQVDWKAEPHGSTREWKRGSGSWNVAIHDRLIGARLYRAAK